MRRHRGLSLAPAAAAILVALGSLQRAAFAYDFALSVRTVGQGYEERRYGPSGASELLTRRRLTQYLTLSVFNIEPEAWRGRDGDRNSVSFELGVRFDSDFGQFLLGRPTGADTITELAQNQIDVLYAYLFARDIAGHADLQLGRQLHYDLVDFYSFDGADVRLRLGRFITAQAFGGTEVRGEAPLSAPLYEIDGTSAGSKDPATRPEQSSALRPMVGGALAIDRASPVEARIAYRRAFAATEDARPGDPSSGVDHESLSFTVDGRWSGKFFVSGGARYNLLLALWDDQQLALRWRPDSSLLLSAEFAYLVPTFDGDSIWNVFASGGYRDFRAGADFELSSVWRVRGRGFFRDFVDPTRASAATDTLAAAAPGGRHAYGGDLGADGRGSRGRVRVDLFAEAGFGGWKVGADLNGRYAWRPNVVDLEGRLTAMTWRPDDVPVPTDSTMIGIGIGALYQMSRKMRLHLLGENNTGTYYRLEMRGLVVLEVDVAL